ncbi:DUF6712 family protein [Adhaeribacter pallidiroseus]|uniref:Uncharacterized protein n=1 Tax=Adhaeribacter pallidiroseus TaxID=2072847 RepID=A0A369QI62_9BACT|nr:DUF6712 family protein [Adhaeribacter pallidiroseus]RDC63275.1 hypothetical protein AHMF7616_01877 [Adhaeribacter pallidiroseus]
MLLNSTPDLKLYYGTLSKNTTFATLKPFVILATQKYLVPAIGSAFLNELTTGITVTAPDSLSVVAFEGVTAELYALLAASLAYYTMLEAQPFLTQQTGNLGTQEANVKDMMPVRQWVYNQAENATAENADRLLDAALELLEKDAELFAFWKNSEQYTISSSLLISSTAELNRYVNIQNSRRAYLALRPYLERAEILYIAPEVGDELLAELKQLSAAPNPELNTLAAKIKPALAQFALKEALPDLPMVISGTGIRILNENDGIRSRLAASESQIANLATKAELLANRYMAEVLRQLDLTNQTGENLPADKNQTWQAPDNTDSASFWV